MDPGLVCRTFFTTGAVVAVGGTLVPSFRDNIMNYGSRKTEIRQAVIPTTHNVVEKTYDYLTSIDVPHTWFIHYYVVSVVSSIFWGFQIAQHGKFLQLVASYSNPGTTSMTVNQVALAWLLMFAHGLRRLNESLTLTKPTNSKMWFGLWALGALYYVFMGISIWIEGASAIDQSKTYSRLTFSFPSAKTITAIPIFLLASWIQNTCHRHLASLRKYSVPTHFFFQSILCPHYTSECFIYVALAIISAPRGTSLNGTVSAGILFVASNLAVTAESTKNWYTEKFGAEAIRGRWRMVPYVY